MLIYPTNLFNLLFKNNTQAFTIFNLTLLQKKYNKERLNRCTLMQNETKVNVEVTKRKSNLIFRNEGTY